MFRVDIVTNDHLVPVAFLDKVHDPVDALGVRRHVKVGISLLVEWHFNTEQIVLTQHASGCKLRQLVVILYGSCKVNVCSCGLFFAWLVNTVNTALRIFPSERLVFSSLACDLEKSSLAFCTSWHSTMAYINHIYIYMVNLWSSLQTFCLTLFALQCSTVHRQLLYHTSGPIGIRTLYPPPPGCHIHTIILCMVCCL